MDSVKLMASQITSFNRSPEEPTATYPKQFQLPHNTSLNYAVNNFLHKSKYFPPNDDYNKKVK